MASGGPPLSLGETIHDAAKLLFPKEFESLGGLTLGVGRIYENEQQTDLFERAANHVRRLLHAGKLKAFRRDETRVPHEEWDPDKPDTWFKLECQKLFPEAIVIGQDHLLRVLSECQIVPRTDEPKRERPGRKPKFDWEAYEREFEERVAREGLPDRLNDDGWQTQADVIRWLQSLAKRDCENMSLDTAKRKARAMIEKRGRA